MMIKRLHNPAAVAAALVVLALFFAIAGVVNSAPVSGKSDRMTRNTTQSCAQRTWPDLPAACLTWQAGAGQRRDVVRMITIETRDEANRTSILTRIPVTATANR